MSKAVDDDADDENENENARHVEFVTGVGSWMIASVGMIVFNKLAANVFPVCSLVALQFMFTVIVVLVFGWHSIHIGSRRDVIRWCRVVPFFTGMLLSSILALKYVPMTLVITFRALSPVVAMVIEYFYPNPMRTSVLTLLSIGVMFSGMMIYMIGMSTTPLAGVGWAVLNNFLAVTDRLLQRLMLAKDQHPVDISKTGVTLLNNSLGFIPLAAAALVLEEWRELPEAISNLTPLSIVWLFASCVVGAAISYTGIWAQSLISATSFLVLVNGNKFIVVFLECWLSRQFDFGDEALTWTQILGATVSILGGIFYSKARELVEAEGKALGTVELVDRKEQDEETSNQSGEEEESATETTVACW